MGDPGYKLDIMAVEFRDRAVVITYYDPKLETEFGSRQYQIMLKPEMFEEEVEELLDDIVALIQAFEERASDIPATRPGRVR